MAMATSRGAVLHTLSLSSLGLRKDSLLSNDAVNSPSATNLPHSSDDSSATIRLDSNSSKGCTSPTSELEATLCPTVPRAAAAAAAAATTPKGRVTRSRRSPAPSPATPVTPPQLTLPPAAVAEAAPTAAAAAAASGGTNSKAAQGAATQPAAQQEASSEVDVVADAVERLPPPDASEGPAVAAEYEAYTQRWQQGTTLAQRWARLASQGKTSSIQTAWEDLQLDLLLQSHCYNTPQAAAARTAAAAARKADAAAAAAAAAAAQASPTAGLGSPRGARRSRIELEVDALEGEGAAAAGGDDSGGEGAAASPATRRVRARQAPKSFRDFEVDLPTGSKSSSGSPEPAATTPTAAAAAFSPAGPHDMDAYIGAGILLDLVASSAPAAKPAPKQQQPKPKPLPKARQQQQQQQQVLSKQVLQQQHQLQQQQHNMMLPTVQTRPKVALVLDLSGSPRHPDSTAAAAAAATGGLCSPGSTVQAGSSSSPGRPQQGQVLHLGLPNNPQSMVSLSPSPLSSQHNHSLPPRPPRMPQQQHTHQLFAAHHFSHQAQPQPQQQQQEAELKPEHIQAALDVATKLGAALGSDSQAFARIMAFVHTNSNKPAALYQFMSATLAQIEGGSTAAAAAAAAAAPAAPGVASTAGKQQQPRGLML